mmetsp:Transcript_30781/g.80547  ORF Transcript_30781/g.80547 Transcript_30781/m.80547 type:complete len:316 (-) Transcript_30781:4306-5253(-)
MLGPSSQLHREGQLCPLVFERSRTKHNEGAVCRVLLPGPRDHGVDVLGSQVRTALELGNDAAEPGLCRFLRVRCGLEVVVEYVVFPRHWVPHSNTERHPRDVSHFSLVVHRLVLLQIGFGHSQAALVPLCVELANGSVLKHAAQRGDAVWRELRHVLLVEGEHVFALHLDGRRAGRRGNPRTASDELCLRQLCECQFVDHEHHVGHCAVLQPACQNGLHDLTRVCHAGGGDATLCELGKEGGAVLSRDGAVDSPALWLQVITPIHSETFAVELKLQALDLSEKLGVDHLHFRRRCISRCRWRRRRLTVQLTEPLR